mgnify:CR=1 FL=1
MTKYLILGGGGVFANQTSKFLLEKKTTKKVVAVGRNPRLPECYSLNVGLNDKKYEYHQIHIVFELDRLITLIDKIKPDYIINFAAIAYATSWVGSHRYYDTNLMSVVRLCEELKKKKFLKKFIQIGSSEIFGSSNKPVDESTIAEPTSPYAVSKLATDMHLRTLWNVEKFPMNIVLPSNGYGPGQYMYRLIPKACLYGLYKKKFPLEGGGKVKKSFLHCRDIANAIFIVAHKGKPGETYNAGTEKPNSIKEIVKQVSSSLKVDFDSMVHITPGRIGEDKQYWLNSNKIKALGWKQKISLEKGINEMTRWVTKYAEDLTAKETDFTLRA